MEPRDPQICLQLVPGHGFGRRDCRRIGPWDLERFRGDLLREDSPHRPSGCLLGGVFVWCKNEGEGDGQDGTFTLRASCFCEAWDVCLYPIGVDPLLSAMRETSSVSAAVVRRSIIIGNQQPCLALCGTEHLHGGTDLGA